MNIFNVLLIRIIEGVLKLLLIMISTGPKTVHRPVAPVYSRFLDRSISATLSVSVTVYYFLYNHLNRLITHSLILVVVPLCDVQEPTAP